MKLLPIILLLAALSAQAGQPPVKVTELDRPFAQDSLFLVKQKNIPPAMLRDVGFVRYTALLVRTLEGDTTVDFSRMRFWFTQTSKYDPFCLEKGNRTCDYRDSMYHSFAAKNWTVAREYANKVLQREYCDIDAHSLASAANLELKDSVLSKLQGWTSRKLLESIRTSGDGKSPGSPFKLISLLEERPFLSYLGYTREDVETVEHEGRVLDKVKAKKSGSSKSEEIWFDLTLPYLYLDQLPDSVKAAGMSRSKQ